MTRNEREELLRRFLDGEMDSNQEHDFYINVALDNELRMELKAHQTIDNAIRKDRALDPTEYAPMEMAVAGMLASIPHNALFLSFSRRFLSYLSRHWFMVGIATLLAGASLLLILWPLGQTPGNAHRDTQQLSQPTENQQPEALKGTEKVGSELSGSRTDTVHEQQKHSPADRSIRTEQGKLSVKEVESGLTQNDVTARTSGNESRDQQSSESTPRTAAALEQHKFDDSVKARVNLQMKHEFPKAIDNQ